MAVLHDQVVERDATSAFHHHSIGAIERRYVEGFRCLDHGCRDGLRVANRVDVHCTAAAASGGIRCAPPIFDTTIDVEHRAIAPGFVISFLREVFPIILVTARPYHHVDAGAATEHFAHIERNRALIEMRVRLCDEFPITIGAEIERPLPWREHFGNIVSAARFDQQNTYARVLCEPAR